jgi:hypothetical protein
MWLSEQLLELVSVFIEAAKNFIFIFLFELGRLKNFKKTFAHVQKVLTYLYRP